MKTRESLQLAIKTRNIFDILILLDIDLKPHEKDEDGNTMLHHVLKSKQLKEKAITEILEVFLDDGVDPKTENNRRETALHLAVTKRMKDAIDLLIKFNATINADGRWFITHDFVDDEYKKFWQLSVNSEREKMESESANFVEWLISKGFDFHRRCQRGYSALHLAEEKYLLHIIPTILKHTKNIKCVKLEGRNLFNGTLFEDGWRDLEIAPEESWYVDYRLRHATSIVKILLDRSGPSDEERGPLLNLALWSEEPSIIDMVVNHFPEGCDKKNLATTMFCHILSRRTKCSILRSEWYLKILIDLTARGADVNYRDKSGRSPLYWAVLVKNLKVVKLLKDEGADFNVMTEYGQNLLHTLAEKDFKQVSCDGTEEALFDLLIKEGCQVNARNIRGFTPLHVAASCGNLLIVCKLIDHGASVDCKNDDQQTPLHLAAANPRLPDVAEFLINEGAKLNSRDIQGDTPLHLAATVPTAKGNVAVIRLLLSRGAYLDVRDENGNSALAKAVAINNVVNARELLEHGANSESPCVMKSFQRAFHSLDRKGVIDLLLRHRHILKAVNLPHVDVFYYIEGDEMEFRVECLREVEVLKSTFIDSRTSLYRLLHMDPSSRCIYINNEKLKGIVASHQIQDRFPNYSTLILASYREAVAKKSLLEPAKEAWLMLTRISLPDICVERIFTYLSNDELVTIIGEDF